MAEHHKKVVRNALNAGATLEAVQRQNNNHYLVSSEFYKALANIRARLLQSASHRPQQPYLGGRLRESQPAVPFNRRDRIEHKPLGNGHAINGASEESDEEMRRRFREDLLKKLGLPSEPFAEHGVPSEVRETVARLKGQLRAYPDLRSALESIEQEYKRLLNEATLALKLEHSEDKQALDILEETRQEISQVVLALMLHSERNLFEELRRVVEKGGDAEPLRRRLHALRDHIEGNDLATKLMQ